MSKEDHPSFFGKDASNSPVTPEQKLQRARYLIHKYRRELEQIEYDLKFRDLITREFPQ